VRERPSNSWSGDSICPTSISSADVFHVLGWLGGLLVVLALGLIVVVGAGNELVEACALELEDGSIGSAVSDSAAASSGLRTGSPSVAGKGRRLLSRRCHRRCMCREASRACPSTA